ncbi:transposase [Carboxylicivirga sp. N1Y90]|uniref:transposase n=1 Tax=Carboxylicivirga fragile TaxID=3417571 RepID=UPI003D3451E6|nr:hypothetical protein [Marinilabiliaceae bacterium N1Y90]
MLQIKGDIIYKSANTDRLKNAVGFSNNKWETIDKPDSVTDLSALKVPNPSKHFSHLFNSYSKYFNNKYNRHGALFERPFKRKLIDSEENLKQVVLYIHNNPVHHGFTDHPVEYGWSSYLSCVSNKQTKIKRQEVVDWFDNCSNFEFCHKSKLNLEKIGQYLGI